MTDLLTQGLLITVIGMGLVFLVLIFLWGLINLISRLPFTDDDGKGGEGPADEGVRQSVEEKPLEENSRSLRARAAAAAVAAALGLQKSAVRPAPPQGSETTPWQAARRVGQFSMNAQITTRKPRGSAR